VLKKVILILLGIVLIGANVYFLIINSDLKRILQKSEEDFKKQLSMEQEKIRKDSEEKYRADMVSYQAMAKRIELEKNKTKEMQLNIENLEKEIKNFKGRLPKKTQ